jgi:hypothetical protein
MSYRQHNEESGYDLEWSPTEDAWRAYLAREVELARANLARSPGPVPPTLHSYRTIQRVLAEGSS